MLKQTERFTVFSFGALLTSTAIVGQAQAHAGHSHVPHVHAHEAIAAVQIWTQVSFWVAIAAVGFAAGALGFMALRKRGLAKLGGADETTGDAS